MKKGRTPRAPKDLVAVRMEREDIRRVNALREHFDSSWHQATQSDVLRALVLRALDDMEQDPEHVLREVNAQAVKRANRDD